MQNKKNPDEMTLFKLFGILTIRQLWSILGALAIIIGGTFSISQFINNYKIDSLNFKLGEQIIQNQSLEVQKEFYVRAFEYYRAVEKWQKKQGHHFPTVYNIDYCDDYLKSQELQEIEDAIDYLGTAVERLRDEAENSEIGVIEPRGGNVSKSGGGLSIKFPSGEIWHSPQNLVKYLNPNGGPCRQIKPDVAKSKYDKN